MAWLHVQHVPLAGKRFHDERSSSTHRVPCNTMQLPGAIAAVSSQPPAECASFVYTLHELIRRGQQHTDVSGAGKRCRPNPLPAGRPCSAFTDDPVPWPGCADGAEAGRSGLTPSPWNSPR